MHCLAQRQRAAQGRQPSSPGSRAQAFRHRQQRCGGPRAAAPPASASAQPDAAAAADAASSAPAVAVSRRELGGVAASLVLAQLLPAAAPPAALADTQAYADPQDGFKLAVPAGWQQSEGVLEGNRSFTGASGARRTLAWFPADQPAHEVNVSLTITNTSVEFTKLGSFGNVYTFSQNLVNSMDRSFLLRARRAVGTGTPDEPVQVAKLLDARDARGMYQLEYSVEKIPGPKRHLYSVVALANNGRYNRLYTLTAQCLEEQVAQFEPLLLQVLDSFEPPAAMA